ncbi:MAG: hypothetical protein K8T26_12170 [Lentisphaerae bacterium]|nr:hypothetical protein [Lentisphaerota bacterium]
MALARTAVTLAFGVALASVRPASGGTISMQVTCRVDGTNLVVEIVNAGDEAAQNIVGRVDFNGTIVETPPLQSLPPSEPRGVPVGLSLAGLRGLYPVIVVVNFEDLNGYPFSTVSVLQVTAEDAQPSDLLGVLSETSIRGKTPMAFRIRNDHADAITARYHLVAPRELLAGPATGEVSVPGSGTATVPLTVENFSALPNSRYGLHAVLEYDAEGRHYTTVASTTVTVLQPRASGSRFFLVAILIVAAAIAGSFLFKRPSASVPNQMV